MCLFSSVITFYLDEVFGGDMNRISVCNRHKCLSHQNQTSVTPFLIMFLFIFLPSNNSLCQFILLGEENVYNDADYKDSKQNYCDSEQHYDSSCNQIIHNLCHCHFITFFVQRCKGTKLFWTDQKKSPSLTLINVSKIFI